MFSKFSNYWAGDDKDSAPKTPAAQPKDDAKKDDAQKDGEQSKTNKTSAAKASSADENPTSLPAEFFSAQYPLFSSFKAVTPCDNNSVNEISDPAEERYKLRGVDYFSTYVKIESGEPLYELIGVDHVKYAKNDSKPESAAEDPFFSLKKARDRGFTRFVFSINFACTGEDFVLYWTPRETAARAEAGLGAESPLTGNAVFDALLAQLLGGQDAERNGRLKIIPKVVEGGYIMRSLVTGKPSLLCNKIRTAWRARGQGEGNYVQATVHIASSSTAELILGSTRAYGSSVRLDLAFTLEGRCEAELPEESFCAVRLNRMDPAGAVEHGPRPQ